MVFKVGIGQQCQDGRPLREVVMTLERHSHGVGFSVEKGGSSHGRIDTT